jgi:SM-20-related protein
MASGNYEIWENVLDPALHRAVWEACSSKRWYFGNFSVDAGEPGFWKMDLDGDPVLDRAWAAARARCEKSAGHGLRVIRQYANGHTYGLGGQAHADDTREGHYTLLYYPMPEWRMEWAGETVFHQFDGDVAATVLPRPNRAVFFDSRIPHAGRAPSRLFGGLRVTVAFKLGPA